MLLYLLSDCITLCADNNWTNSCIPGPEAGSVRRRVRRQSNEACRIQRSHIPGEFVFHLELSYPACTIENEMGESGRKIAICHVRIVPLYTSESLII